LTGVGPLIAWRKSSLESLKRAFLWPMAAGAAVAITLAALGVRNFYALVSFALCTFVAVTVLIEFYKGASAIKAKTGANLLVSMVELTHRNTPRYGGYLVHMGVVLMFIGFTGKAFDRDTTVEVTPGSVVKLGSYELRTNPVVNAQNENYISEALPINVSKNGEDLGVLSPEHRVYIASKQPTSEVAIRRRLNEDLYLNFAGMSADNQRAVLQAYVFPLVSWIWIGYWVVLIGTLICLTPAKTRMAWPRTQVVGIAGKHEQVEK
ncbi:MAG TPA: cytochrome c-type biogenesis CcmF C-terminal domain-containing protein, partial [Bryobacteraceae bacterium]|nr:cytochrome c-type biogenesis CcmF C-terminal domain-containing protein [Bryobacteraceae bacterium]